VCGGGLSAMSNKEFDDDDDDDEHITPFHKQPNLLSI